MKKIILSISFLIITIVTTIILIQQNKNNNNKEDNTKIETILYSWKMIDTTLEERTKLLSIIKEHNVKIIYQDFSSEHLKSGDDEFIRTMNKVGVEILHMAGNPKWGIAGGTDKIIAEIDKVISFNNRNVHKIKGLLLDIEPYTSEIIEDDETFGERELKVFVDNMKEAYKYAKDNDIEIVLAIPYWYDKKSETLLEELIKDCCDEISVMNYRINKTLKDIETEIKLSKKYNKKINTIYEINFEKSDYFQSYDAILEDYNKLIEYYDYSNLRIAYHHYDKMK